MWCSGSPSGPDDGRRGAHEARVDYFFPAGPHRGSNDRTRMNRVDFTDDELRDLYDRYAPVLFHRCNGILRDREAAHDAVHETFARVIRNADTFRAQASPLTWMYRISTNYCLNQVRDRGARQSKLHVHRDEIGGSGITEVDGADRRDIERLLGLLDGADEETRLCVIHTYYDDCTREEVAELVGLSVPTVRKRINTFLDRARRTLGVGLVASAALVLGALTWSLP